jgi:nucleotide-binding universal stress UspA family protein
MLAQYKLLLTTDLSGASEQVITKALIYAHILKAEIYVLYVVEPIITYGYTHLSLENSIENELLIHGKERLQHIVEHCQIPADHIIVKLGNIKAEVIATANMLKVDAIIVGAHAKNNTISKFLLGSTADKIINTAPCDVFVLQPWLIEKE